MAEEKIKIVINRVVYKRNVRIPGNGKARYTITVDGRLVGRSSDASTAERVVFLTRRAAVHEFGWSTDVNVKHKQEVKLRVEAKDTNARRPQVVGLVEVTLKAPFRQQTHVLAPALGGCFMLDYDVLLYVGGRARQHPPNTLFATRQHTGAVSVTTVSGAQQEIRMEFHPVRPTPTTGLPDRPNSMTKRAEIEENVRGVTVTPSSPMNVIPNPSVIPILSSRGGDKFLRENAARIEFTWCCPKSMKFKDDDQRLKWKTVALAEGPSGAPPAVRFVGRNYGRKVLVYGRSAGEVQLELWFNDVRLAFFRALVMEVRKVKCRFNILMAQKKPKDSPRSRAGHIAKHMAIANRFLRQAGLELILDDNDTLTDHAQATSTPGIFTIEVPVGQTKNATQTDYCAAALLNAREKVLNFAYIHSADDGSLGAGLYWEGNDAGAQLTDSGRPSSSWKSRSGMQYVANHRPAPVDAVQMDLIAADPAPGQANRFCVYITEAHGHPNSQAQEYGGTITHEFGHLLCLGHRNLASDNNDFQDNVEYPEYQNVMHYNNPTTIAQDLDLVQTKAMHQSKLFS